MMLPDSGLLFWATLYSGKPRLLFAVQNMAGHTSYVTIPECRRFNAVNIMSCSR